MEVYYPESKTKNKEINFGEIRAYIECSLFGFAGASVLGSVSFHCGMNSKGQLKAKGTNTLPPANKQDKGQGTEVGVNAFAGAGGSPDLNNNFNKAGIKPDRKWAGFRCVINSDKSMSELKAIAAKNIAKKPWYKKWL